MCGEAKTGWKDRSGKAGVGCCPDNFQEMFSKMSSCCVEKDIRPDCAEIMTRMKADCCSLDDEGEKK